jgi:predicted metal-dependent phosphoesterase TrpH
MKVDFHIHSTASDGTFAPKELIAKASGFSALALTDHDNMDGVGEFVCAAGVAGISVCAGVELSIEPGDGFDRFHLLALGVNPADDGLQALLARVLRGRNGRNGRILANFSRIGIVIEPDDIARYAHGDVLARPHIARWLVDHGFARDVKTAFDTFLLPDSPAATRCYEERWHPSQEETFRTVHRAGGLCVMAHPKYWRGAWRRTGVDFAAAERELAVLREKGLDGIEALYEANTPAENVEFTRLGRRHGFLLSAGSDFHGANKPSIALGMEVSEAFAAPLLDALGLRRADGVSATGGC